MSETASQSDLSLGLGLFFGVLAFVGAAGMYLAYANQLIAGASFALAVTAGCLAIAAIHVYDS
jgi:hypothetical protein